MVRYIILNLEGNTNDKADLNSMLKEILSEKANVNSSNPKITLETRDLYCLTTLDEVQEVAKRSLWNFGPCSPERTLRCGFLKNGTNHDRQSWSRPMFYMLRNGHRQAHWTGPCREGEGICVKCGERNKRSGCTNNPRRFLYAKWTPWTTFERIHIVYKSVGSSERDIPMSAKTLQDNLHRSWVLSGTGTCSIQ